jgi:hypothetical protein
MAADGRVRTVLYLQSFNSLHRSNLQHSSEFKRTLMTRAGVFFSPSVKDALLFFFGSFGAEIQFLSSPRLGLQTTY